MNVIPTDFKDVFILEPKVFSDSRGYFFESFNAKNFYSQTGLDISFVQDNQSQSSYGTIRGLHFQKGESAQTKLVRVLTGKILDVIVDLRPDSETLGKSFSIELSSENKRQLFIPRGFAHGFSVLSEKAEFFYKCDNYYNPHAEGGVFFADEELAINWIIPSDQIILSEKDKALPRLDEVLKSL